MHDKNWQVADTIEHELLKENAKANRSNMTEAESAFWQLAKSSGFGEKCRRQYIQLSARGEYEITTVNQKFLEDGELKVQTLGRGFAWLDTGTHDSLSESSTYIKVLEKRQGLKVACLDGIAYRQGWITEERMRDLAKPMLKNQYGQYLLKVFDEVKETGQANLD